MRNSRLRTEDEIAHGRILALGDTEWIWGWDTPAGRQRAERRAGLIARGARLGPGKKALEIGCGTGLFTEIFAETGAQVVAVDLSPDLLEKARARELRPDRVQFLEAPFEDCGIHGPFDAIIGSSVLHHLDITAALAKIYQLLKPGGIMSFAEPNMLNPQVFMERRFRSFRKWFWYISPDETAFIRGQLRNLLVNAGFQNIDITPFDWLHPATPQPMIGLIHRLGLILEGLPGIREFAGSLYIRGVRP
jgi:SAM-dependent methyltransferase